MAKVLLPSFSDLSEAYPHATLVGKLLVLIIGITGGGNGRCLASTNLPTPGMVVLDRWQIRAYSIDCIDHTLHLTIHVIDTLSKAPVAAIQKVVSPPLRVTDRAYDEARNYGTKADLSAALKKYLAKGPYSDEEMDRLVEDIREFAEHGRAGGSIELQRFAIDATVRNTVHV